MRSLSLLLMCVHALTGSSTPIDRDGIVFPGAARAQSKEKNVITPPILPVLAHLEYDPSTLTAKAIKSESDSRQAKGIKSRISDSDIFKITPNGNRGFSANFDNNFAGASSQSHSLSANFNNGFQVSQSSSQSSNFGSTGSQSSSQSASFSAGQNGLSSSQSGASSFGGNFLGNSYSNSAAQSSSSASGFGPNGPSSAFGQSSGFGSAFGDQTFSNGQSAVGSFGDGTFSQAAGSGFASNFHNIAASQANANSLASVNGRSNEAPPIVFPGETEYRRQPSFKPIPSAFDNRGPQQNKRWRGFSEQSIPLGGGDFIKIITY